MKQQYFKFKTIMLMTCVFILKANGIVFSGEHKVDAREMAVDLAIGGMKQGSHILTPKEGAGIHQAPKIPGSELSPKIHTSSSNPNVTGTQTSGNANLGTPGGGDIENGNTKIETPTTTPETMGSGSTDTSIITVGADTNLSEDNINVDANLAIDPNAGGALLDADVTASTDTVNQALTSDTGLAVDVSKDTASAEMTTIGTEDGTSTAAPIGEAESGLEADVEATGSSDATDNPADGISSLP